MLFFSQAKAKALLRIVKNLYKISPVFFSIFPPTNRRRSEVILLPRRGSATGIGRTVLGSEEDHESADVMVPQYVTYISQGRRGCD